MALATQMHAHGPCPLGLGGTESSRNEQRPAEVINIFNDPKLHSTPMFLSSTNVRAVERNSAKGNRGHPT